MDVKIKKSLKIERLCGPDEKNILALYYFAISLYAFFQCFTKHKKAKLCIKNASESSKCCTYCCTCFISLSIPKTPLK